MPCFLFSCAELSLISSTQHSKLLGAAWKSDKNLGGNIPSVFNLANLSHRDIAMKKTYSASTDRAVEVKTTVTHFNSYPSIRTPPKIAGRAQ